MASCMGLWCTVFCMMYDPWTELFVSLFISISIEFIDFRTLWVVCFSWFLNIICTYMYMLCNLCLCYLISHKSHKNFGRHTRIMILWWMMLNVKCYVLHDVLVMHCPSTTSTSTSTLFHDLEFLVRLDSRPWLFISKSNT